ncbi:MAG: hypothetical protein FWE08_06070 [Oscillospiraceae bacterium]|nr:hypothetical protein [Oscillospiraceae bacterium]
MYTFSFQSDSLPECIDYLEDLVMTLRCGMDEIKVDTKENVDAMLADANQKVQCPVCKCEMDYCGAGEYVCLIASCRHRFHKSV